MESQNFEGSLSLFGLVPYTGFWNIYLRKEDFLPMCPLPSEKTEQSEDQNNLSLSLCSKRLPSVFLKGGKKTKDCQVDLWQLMFPI